MRVPLHSVDAWWITDFRVKNTGGGLTGEISVSF